MSRRAIVVLLALAACGGISPVQTPELPDSDVIAGFDTRTYPGATTMQAWKTNSPYGWVGYYLPAPCYTGTTWVGKRAELVQQKWGLAVLYVGEQDWRAMGRTDTAGAATQNPRCTASNLTAENGRLHAQAADSAARAEGFANGTLIFLDVERVDSVSANLTAYVQAFVAEMLERGTYVPSLYAHERNVAVLFKIFESTFASAKRRDRPRLWVAKSGAEFTIESRPSESGLLGASIWQGQHNIEQTWGGVTLRIDANVASVNVPGLRPR